LQCRTYIWYLEFSHINRKYYWYFTGQSICWIQLGIIIYCSWIVYNFNRNFYIFVPCCPSIWFKPGFTFEWKSSEWPQGKIIICIIIFMLIKSQDKLLYINILIIWIWCTIYIMPSSLCNSLTCMKLYFMKLKKQMFKMYNK